MKPSWRRWLLNKERIPNFKTSSTTWSWEAFPQRRDVPGQEEKQRRDVPGGWCWSNHDLSWWTGSCIMRPQIPRFMRLAVPESWKLLILHGWGPQWMLRRPFCREEYLWFVDPAVLVGRGERRRQSKMPWMPNLCYKKRTGSEQVPTTQTYPCRQPVRVCGVDALQLPQTVSGSGYVVVFMDYLTKINGQRPSPPQTKVRRQLPSFWWNISYADMEYHRNCCLTEVPTSCQVCCWISAKSGIQKINTSAYHPQTNGMVEKFNHTLLEMIAQHAAHYRGDWDRYLECVLFAYRVKPHDTIGESPFYLPYGRDAKLPLDSTLA